MVRGSRLGWVASIGLLACGPSIGAVGESDGSSGRATSTDAPPQATTSTTGVPPGTSIGDATSDPTIDPPGTSTSTGSGSSGDGTTGEPASVCDPQPEELLAALRIDPEDDTEVLSLDLACEVDAFEEIDPAVTRVRLRCAGAVGEEMHAVDVWADPPLPLPVALGDGVGLRAERALDPGGLAWEHVAIYDAGGELLLGMQGDLAGPDAVDLAAWFLPFSFTLQFGVCKPDPPVETDFIGVPCEGTTERLAFMVASPWAMGHVYDDGHAVHGDYEVRVPHAYHRIPNVPELCRVGPYTVARIVFYRLP